jgi:hypothetical protein
MNVTANRLRMSGGGATPFENTKSVVFDGVDDYVIASLDGTSSGGVLASADGDINLTISMWFKASTTGAQQGFLQWANGLTDGTPFLIIQQLTTNVRLFVNGNYQVSTVINIGTWYNIIITRTSSSNIWTVYLDGSSVGTYDDGGTSLSNRASATDIYLANGWAGYVEGNIDEVAIWNTDETANVSAIYNSGVPDDLSSLSPLSWWRMGDGDTYPTITDHGSGGNDGTMTNMTSGDIVSDVP